MEIEGYMDGISDKVNIAHNFHFAKSWMSTLALMWRGISTKSVRRVAMLVELMVDAGMGRRVVERWWDRGGLVVRWWWW